MVHYESYNMAKYRSNECMEKFIRTDVARELRRETVRKARPDKTDRASRKNQFCSVSLVRQNTRVSAAAMLVDDSFAGLFVDLIALSAGLGYIFGCGFVAVP